MPMKPTSNERDSARMNKRNLLRNFDLQRPFIEHARKCEAERIAARKQFSTDEMDAAVAAFQTKAGAA